MIDPKDIVPLPKVDKTQEALEDLLGELNSLITYRRATFNSLGCDFEDTEDGIARVAKAIKAMAVQARHRGVEKHELQCENERRKQ